VFTFLNIKRSGLCLFLRKLQVSEVSIQDNNINELTGLYKIQKHYLPIVVFDEELCFLFLLVLALGSMSRIKYLLRRK
jgi:hypothetical protein